MRYTKLHALKRAKKDQVTKHLATNYKKVTEDVETIFQQPLYLN